MKDDVILNSSKADSIINKECPPGNLVDIQMFNTAPVTPPRKAEPINLQNEIDRREKFGKSRGINYLGKIQTQKMKFKPKLEMQTNVD